MASEEPSPAPPPVESLAHMKQTEYVSDPEDAVMHVIRRREASDDENAEVGGSGAGSQPEGVIKEDESDREESEGQGGAQVYDEDELYEEDVEEGLYDEVGEVDTELRKTGEDAKMGVVKSVVVEEKGHGDEEDGQGQINEKEPYSVPTLGAFYMHDDREQQSGRGRRRQMFSGRKLLTAQDDHAWVHDRFEEMNLHDSHYSEEKRRPRGRFRGRGGRKPHAADGGFPRGGRSRTIHNEGSNQDLAPKVVRGRGPRHYESLQRSNHETTTQNKKSPRSQKANKNANPTRKSSQSTNFQPEPLAPPEKHVFASSLNSASPPFYPSCSSNKDLDVAQPEPAQTGRIEKHFLSDKALSNSVQHDQLHCSGFTQSSNLQDQGTSLSLRGPQTSQSTISYLPLQRAPQVQNQQTRTSVYPVVVQASKQTTEQISSHQLNLQIGDGSSALPSLQHPQTGSGLREPSANSKVPKTPLAGRGNIGNQDDGKGSFTCTGGQIIGATGAMGIGHVDQAFSGTPAFLPVMHFGNQNQGGLRGPTIGMAVPGYVAQQQVGAGNAEMTWVPVLATGPAGAFRGSYPYISLDASFYNRQPGQTSASISSRENRSKSSNSPPTV